MRSLPSLAAGCVLAALTCAAQAVDRPHNVVLFIPDGLRAVAVTPDAAPALAALRDSGVNFRNPHSLFPTFTMPNSSGMATGHYIGDTGVFSNTIFAGFQVPSAANSVTPFLESDPVLGDVDEHFSGNYVDEDTVLKLARDAGFSTAAIGKLGPTLMFDHTERTGERTIVVDDATGTSGGIPLGAEMKHALAGVELPFAAPSRGDNGKAGTATSAGTLVANANQQNYFVDVATKVVLPMFKARNTPFVLVFWSRDPDGTQHNQGDSLNALTPGINGPTSLAAIRNADDDLARIRRALDELGLADSTDIVVAADHGFSTIGKQSRTSQAAKARYSDVPEGFLPPGFLALDLASALHLPLHDPDAKNAPVGPGAHPTRSNGLLGTNPGDPEVIVAANGGSDLVYLPRKDKALAGRIVRALLAQDYVSGIFVDDALGRFPGTLPLSAINLKGSVVTPLPAIAVNFTTFATGCPDPLACTVEIADTGLQQGQGMHGSFSRADTMNFMAATGPDFKSAFVDPVPVSNADVGITIAHILGLDVSRKGKLVGRVLTESMPGGAMPRYSTHTLQSAAGAGGLRTIVRYQAVGNTRYFDAAGFPGRTVGLTEDSTRERALKAAHAAAQ
jgi:hypothetical protein